MLIFSGLGILVPVFYVSGLWISYWAIDEVIMHQTGYSAATRWPQCTAILLVGLACYALGKLLHRRTGKKMIDPGTGKEVMVGGYHSFFFIPMHWWGFVCAAIAIYVAFHG